MFFQKSNDNTTTNLDQGFKMSEDDFYQTKCEIVKLLIKFNAYAKSSIVDYFAEDLNDIDIDDDVMKSICGDKTPSMITKKLPKYIRTAR